MADAPTPAPGDRQQAKDSGGILSGVSDALHSAAYSAIEQPLDGVAQIVSHVTPWTISGPGWVSKPEHDNLWTSAGSVVGNVADFYVLSKGVGLGRQSMFGRAASVPILEAGTTGALFELTMPVDDKDFYGNKLRNAAIGFGTFATMNGASIGLRNYTAMGKTTGFLGTVGVSGLSGAAGGLSHSLLDSGFNSKPITLEGVGKDVASYGAFGAMFGALDYGVNKGTGAITSRINDRISNGKPIVSFGPIEVHPRGYAVRAQELAQVDGLTGMKNKTGGREAMQSEIARAARSNEPLSMTYADLDNFKVVNDKFGHNQGDEVLKEFSDFMRRFYSRGTDVHIRDGGDEFMAVMPNTALSDASRLADKFEQSMRLGVSNGPPTAEQLMSGYPAQLAKLEQLPRSVTAQDNQTVLQLAEQLIQARQPITGETLNSKSIDAEGARLKARIGFEENENVGGKTLQVYNDQDIANLANKTAFRFLPQLGQLLKLQGVSETQVEEALKVQGDQPPDNRQLIGEILVDKGYATKDQVDDVFKQQLANRESLSRVLEGYLGGQSVVADVQPFRMQQLMNQPVNNITLRDGIPQVYRPQLGARGVRVLQPFENPVGDEVVVGASTGVVQWNRPESPDEFKQRGDGLMFDKKAQRKAQGLRRDRVEPSSLFSAN